MHRKSCSPEATSAAGSWHTNGAPALSLRQAMVARMRRGGGVCTVPAQAADFPSKPVTMIVPYPAGGATDVVARAVAEKLGGAWRQSVIVENRAGRAPPSAPARWRARPATATRCT